MSVSGSEPGADLGRWPSRERTKTREGTAEITDTDAALSMVWGFIAALYMSYDLYYDRTIRRSVGQREQISKNIREQLPLIQQIAARIAPELMAELKEEGDRWPYHGVLAASYELSNRLNSVKEAERMLGPLQSGPSAANLHPLVWNAAARLWNDGHFREAVQSAAMALFDHHLPAKLGVPAKPSAKDLVAQAFSTDPPNAANPRLRLTDYPEEAPSWTSQHEGARFFGMGCAQLIRNLITHGAQPDEQTALEQLTSLSLLTRLIDRAEVVAAQAP